MSRTVEDVDADLRAIWITRQKIRAELRKRLPGRDVLLTRETMAVERIEHLLEERSQIMLLDQVASL